MFSRIIAAFVFLSVSTPVQAGWIYQSNESAFGGETLHFMVAANGNYGFGLRCKDVQSLEMIYITPDRSFDEATLSLANATKPILLVRVDKNPVHELDASVTLDGTDGKAVFIASVDAEVLKEIGVAKQKISVATQLLGENYHEQSFGARGSTRTSKKLVNACELGSSD